MEVVRAFLGHILIFFLTEETQATKSSERKKSSKDKQEISSSDLEAVMTGETRKIFCVKELGKGGK